VVTTGARPRARTTRSCLAVVAVVALTASGCGSLQSRDEIAAAAGVGVARGAGQGAQGFEGGVEDGVPVGEGGEFAPGEVPGAASTGGSEGVTGTEAGSGTSAGGAPHTTGGGGGPEVSAPGARGGPDAAGAGASGGGDKSPVTIGSVSTMSGIAGGAQRPGVVGLQAWVQATNAKGGVNGRPIRLIVRDDQNDPSQNASFTQALVEQSKVVALVSNWASQTQQASADYLKRKQVPVIGGDHTGQSSWGVNPMFFPVATVAKDVSRISIAGLAKAALPAGKNKLGVLVCAEAAVCAEGAKVAEEEAPKVGLEIVYNGSASFAAPGYTAECLNMQNAGVEVVHAIFPASATKKIARDCQRQGLRVIYSLGQGTMEGDFNKDANFDGAAVIQPTFPFNGSSSGVAKEYAAAMKRYAPDQISNPASASGYAAGVAFGAALAKVEGPVTSASLLQALYTFKNETFGGATIPLSYVKGPTVPKRCFFLSVIKSGSYSVQNGGKAICT
jgi:branched-chain amino acid transport system substrate-binding protein